MEHFDYLGVGGLLVGLLGLAVAFYAIRDVRKLVREQVALERNRLYARLVDALAWRFVDPTAEVERERSVTLRDLHEFSFLVRFLDPSVKLDEAQECANYEARFLADTFVKRGHARWRTDVDPVKVHTEMNKMAV